MTETKCGAGETAGTKKARRSGRVSLAVPILIIGSNAEGRVFSEETHTVVVSLHGAGIVSQNKLIAEQELTLRSMETRREAEVRVVGEIAQQGSMHTYGVAFLDERLDFWEMEFPPGPAWDNRPATLVLECGGCKCTVELANGDFEYDICAIHGGLARFCDECGLLTVWSLSHEVMPAMARASKKHERVVAPGGTLDSALPVRVEKPAVVGVAVTVAEVSEAAENFVSLADAMEGTERRARVRAKVNFFACVRTEKFGEDIVKCVDMARGGVSFRSRNVYEKGMMLEIAVPYSPEVKEAPSIYVKGKIANVKEMATGEMWRCGVEFLRE
jgi:hypothetical protein